MALCGRVVVVVAAAAAAATISTRDKSNCLHATPNPPPIYEASNPNECLSANKKAQRNEQQFCQFLHALLCQC
jgi:hypothetical protein